MCRRVENKKKLDTQAERLLSWCHAQAWSVGQVVNECGSGINDQRPKFLTLLADPKIGQIVVEHTDRASRLAWPPFRHYLAYRDGNW